MHKAFSILKADLENTITLEPELWEQLCEKAELLEIKKGDFLLTAGHVCKYGYYVNKGGFVHTYIGENGRESVVGFSIDQSNRFLSSAKSYYSETQSSFEIKAIQNSEVIRFLKTDLETLAGTYLSFARFYHKIVADALLNMYVFNAVRLSLSSEEFIKYLYNEYPIYLQSIPDKYLAQFMGVSNEWFCKLKKRVVIKQTY